MGSTGMAEQDGTDVAEALGPDALLKLVHFGEALSALTEHVGDRFLSGPPEPILSVLETAYAHLGEVRVSFPPEEFTLLVMSRLLADCTDTDEAKAFQRGAVRYIARSASRLPPDYASIVEDARRMMRENADTGVMRAAVLRERRRRQEATPS